MHDPHTVAFEIKRPWPTRYSGSKTRYWPSLITIWHVDPERGGGPRPDDSCGWFHPRIKPAVRAQVEKIARSEFAFYFGAHGYRMTTFEAVFNVWRRLAWEFRKTREISHKELLTIHELASDPTDNFRWTFEKVPTSGHVREEVPGIHDEDACVEFFMSIHRCYARCHRRAWQHPRWHIWHWKIQVHPWQTLRRWLFSRCCKCGKRFAYGESPFSGHWDSPKHHWWQSEVGVYHGDCSGHSVCEAANT